MRIRWSDAFERVATALRRRRSAAEGEGPDVTDESGFTLIELMVVLLIMGILMAIAIPTFLGVTSTANDTSAQSNLTNVMTSASAIYAKSDAYPTTPATSMAKRLKADEPEFTYTTGQSVAQKDISVHVVNATELIVAAWMTKTKVCWFAKDTNAAGTTAGVSYNVAKTATTCKAATAPSSGWTSKWPTAPTGH